MDVCLRVARGGAGPDAPGRDRGCRRGQPVRGRARVPWSRLADHQSTFAVFANVPRHARADPLGLRGAEGQGRGRRRAPRRAGRAAGRRREIARGLDRAAPGRRAGWAVPGPGGRGAAPARHARGDGRGAAERDAGGRGSDAGGRPARAAVHRSHVRLGHAGHRARAGDPRDRVGHPPPVRVRALADPVGRGARRLGPAARAGGRTGRPRHGTSEWPPRWSAPTSTPPSLVAARQNAAAAGMDDAIVFEQADVATCSGAGRRPRWPPTRLTASGCSRPSWTRSTAAIGQTFQRLSGWRAIVLSGNPALEQASAASRPSRTASGTGRWRRGFSATICRRENRHDPRAVDRPRISCAGPPGLSILSGVLLFLAVPGFGLWPLMFVAMVPQLWVARAAATPRRAFLYGWLTGTIANAGGFYWMDGLLEGSGTCRPIEALPIMLLLVAYQGLAFALFSWGSCGAPPAHRAPAGAAGAAGDGHDRAAACRRSFPTTWRSRWRSSRA